MWEFMFCACRIFLFFFGLGGSRALWCFCASAIPSRSCHCLLPRFFWFSASRPSAGVCFSFALCFCFCFCFSASLLFCFSAFLLLCFSAALLQRIVRMQKSMTVCMYVFLYLRQSYDCDYDYYCYYDDYYYCC